MQNQIYTPAARWWPGGNLILQDSSGDTLLTFPIAFLTQGQVATWDYIHEVLGMCFTGGVNLTTLDGTEKTRADPIIAETLVVTSDDAGLTPVRGPRFKDKFRAPADVADDSTVSRSSRPTVNQSHFYDGLIARDAFCLVTDTKFESCMAAHILPLSRPEYYVEVLGLPRKNAYLFLTAYGLLLSKDIHSEFASGGIAFYPVGENLVIHVFKARGDYRQYHGKVLGPDRFRAQYGAPNVDLLRFHYRHCCIKYMRGYAAFMNIPRVQ